MRILVTLVLAVGAIAFIPSMMDTRKSPPSQDLSQMIDIPSSVDLTQNAVLDQISVDIQYAKAGPVPRQSCTETVNSGQSCSNPDCYCIVRPPRLASSYNYTNPERQVPLYKLL